MNNKVLIFGLLCLLSHGLKAMDDLAGLDHRPLKDVVSSKTSPAVARADKPESKVVDSDKGQSSTTVSKESSEVPKKTSMKKDAVPADKVNQTSEVTKDASGTRCALNKWFTCPWSKRTKIAAGAAAVVAVVWWLCQYGCRCCSDTTSKTIVRADTQ